MTVQFEGSKKFRAHGRDKRQVVPPCLTKWIFTGNHIMARVVALAQAIVGGPIVGEPSSSPDGTLCERSYAPQVSQVKEQGTCKGKTWKKFHPVESNKETRDGRSCSVAQFCWPPPFLLRVSTERSWARSAIVRARSSRVPRLPSAAQTLGSHAPTRPALTAATSYRNFHWERIPSPFPKADLRPR